MSDELLEVDDDNSIIDDGEARGSISSETPGFVSGELVPGTEAEASGFPTKLKRSDIGDID